MFLKFMIFAAVSFVITALIALSLIASQSPKEFADGDAAGGLDFESTVARGISEAPEPTPVPVAGSWSMPVRFYGTNSADKPLLVLVHGSGWVGLQFNSLAKALSAEAYVAVPDLRGHGANPERRGDVDYIGQMEDDLAALIEAKRLDGQKVIMAGHSSGGGLVVRYAGGIHGGTIDKAVLLAPFLKYNATTTRENSGGWARPLTRRFIGLSMLNAVGITALNHLTIIQFNMPKQVREGTYGHLATLAYSYRLNTGFAPRSDYLSDVAALPEFKLIAGRADEAFYAEKYEEVMRPVTDKGSYHILDGETHLSVVDSEETARLIREMLK